MREAVDRIEALIHQEVGRNIDGLFAAAQRRAMAGGIRAGRGARRSVGIITGFYVPLGNAAGGGDRRSGRRGDAGRRADAGRRFLPSRHR